ncbi:MAG: hypothetical protein KGS72_28305 [Cyanobacteria bacterium REEB67]|nr:hypothetical protein [Cyanobacteria bacterium REEB67]
MPGLTPFFRALSCLGLALLIQSLQIYDAAALDDQPVLTALNMQILHKELEIEQNNVTFLMKSHPEGRWKAWRFFAFQEAGTLVLDSGLVVGLTDREHQIKHHGRISGVLLENALVLQMVGQLVCAVGDVIELGLNARQSVMARHQGMDARTAKRRAIRLHNELLALLGKRRQLLGGPNGLTPIQVRVAEAETRVLDDEERLLWLQCSRTLIDARRLVVSENSFYVLDIAKNLSGAAGNLVGIESTHLGQPHVNLHANVLTTVSGGLIMANPILSRLVGRAAGRSYSDKLDHRYKGEMARAVEALNVDTAALKKIGVTNAAPDDQKNRQLFTRVELYAKNQENASRYIDAQKLLDKKGNNAALGRIAVGLFAGATKVSSGICGIIAADGLSANSGAPLLLGGTASYTVGASVIALDNINLNVKRERRVQREAREGTSTQAVLAKRLAALEEIDNHLREVEKEF